MRVHVLLTRHTHARRKPEWCVVQLGIIRCILNCLLSIVAGFLWRVEGGGGDTKKDDAADRMYVVWDFVTCIAHQGPVTAISVHLHF